MTEAAERLRRRYPRSRLPRPLLIVMVGLLAAVALGWLLWAATVQSHPAVAGRVSAFTVQSDTSIRVTVTVDRRDPSVPVVCVVQAQATDFEPVAEKKIEVGPRPERLVDVTIELRTLRRATSASLKSCTVR
ncbi:hypothetical protein JOE57_000927 [Microlunatus panaciterrae]|uniref:DUF4307 domain-containing protein n=1 Tax=Microlunatus panaciterrae TaxID=400768 RepID=A0ABS2RG80_9ACTN|nr:DUF4307 domain-containing protein [Microlunatus panaciterrae]MBM7798006.1 hypothetical protein [Microlunatus panaciterrae]